MRQLTAIDIFSGCGGLTLGLKKAGFKVLGAVDNDHLSVETYKVNHPEVEVWEIDIRDLKAATLMKKLNLKKRELDLLAGCPPCQAFSSMRRLNGRRRIRDKKTKDLVFDYLRFVKALLPKVLLIENVPRLVEDYRFKQVKKCLHELGYKGQPALFNAADYGIPQRRSRMVFIVSRIGSIDYAEPIESGLRLTVRDAIGDLAPPGETGDPLHDFPEKRSERITHHIKMIPKDGGSRAALGKHHQLQCHKKCSGFKDVYGRMTWDKPAPTITGGCVNPSKGRFLHPEQNRTITLREASLLQSFPSDYFFSLEHGKFSAALMIGNAFPPEFVKLHAVPIVRFFKRHNGRI